MSSDEVRIVSATGGEKGSKPCQLGLIDPLALEELGKIAGFGAEKYDKFNYMKGYDWDLSYSAAQRHQLQFWQGQDFDDESGLHHLAHAAWHMLCLYSFYTRGLGTDTRPPPLDEPF